MSLFNRKINYRAGDQTNCQNSGSLKALIYQEEANRVANLTLQYLNIETGGSLFGYWTHSGSPIVSFVCGPGIGSRHYATSFYQNENYLYDIGTKLYDRHGLQHIGEWHSHHLLGLNKPSSGDIDTILSGMLQKNWSRFLLLIATIEDPDKGLVLESYYLFCIDNRNPFPLRIITLPGSSPFRSTEEIYKEEEIHLVPSFRWRPGPFTPYNRQDAHKVFPDAWFTSDRGKALLMKIVKDFNTAGIECRIVTQLDNRDIVEIQVNSDSLLIGPDFPQTAPKWIKSEVPANLDPWSPSTNMVEWYIRAKEINKF